MARVDLSRLAHEGSSVARPDHSSLRQRQRQEKDQCQVREEQRVVHQAMGQQSRHAAREADT